jgi:hypothetical protein
MELRKAIVDITDRSFVTKLGAAKKKKIQLRSAAYDLRQDILHAGHGDYIILHNGHAIGFDACNNVLYDNGQQYAGTEENWKLLKVFAGKDPKRYKVEYKSGREFVACKCKVGFRINTNIQ